MHRPLTALLLAATALLAAAAPASAAPLGLTCAAQQGVEFCQGQVPSWDGTPLDVNVTLPSAAPAQAPLIILSHGWGGSKYPLTDPEDAGGVSNSSLPWARRGYAVLSITARGFSGSCGSLQARFGAGCEKGWIRLDDIRYEVRDAQHMAGRLVDEGYADPSKIGVHGGSYGGAVSNALALLRNRIMLPDGSYAPWRSPGGRQLQLAAAAPYIPWSDLVYALTPNGRNLDYTLPPPDESRKPLGVMKQSFVSGLYALGSTSGRYAAPGQAPRPT